MLRHRLVLATCSALALVAPACGDDAATPTEAAITVTVTGQPSGSVAGSTQLAGLVVEAKDEKGEPVSKLKLALSAVAGGGSVTPTSLETDAAGRATFSWTLGALPIANVVALDAGDKGVFETTVDVSPAAALVPAQFGDVNAFLTTNAVQGSTEDLAFRADGKLMLGVPGGLLSVSADGAVTSVATTGEALVRPLGLAFDQAGRLWIADGDADALMRLGTDLKVTKVADRDGVEPFVAPNDVAIGPDGRVYLSDTCTGKVYALSADGVVLARAIFEAKSEGGPNGLVVGPDGALWVTTENTGLFCAHDDVVLTDAVAGLFRIPLTADGFGPRETVQTKVAVFGDGLAFDGNGNLYAIFDTIDGLALDETIVFVLPKGGTTLRRAFAAREKVWANLAFGVGTGRDTTLYLSLLATPPFTAPEARGVERIRVDITGMPLPPTP